MDTGFLPRVKRTGRDVNHSITTNAEVKSKWSYTSNFFICLHGVDGDKFTVFTFFFVPWVFTFKSKKALFYGIHVRALKISPTNARCAFLGDIFETKKRSLIVLSLCIPLSYLLYRVTSLTFCVR